MCARTTPTTASAGPKSRPDNRTPSEVGNETGVDPNADVDAAGDPAEHDERRTESVTASSGSDPGRFGMPTWGLVRYLPSFKRWWRVRFRSFLCFFLRIFF